MIDFTPDVDFTPDIDFTPEEPEDKFEGIRNVSPNIGAEGDVIKRFMSPVTDLAKDTASYYMGNAKEVAKPLREAVEKYEPKIEEMAMKSGNPTANLIGNETNWLRTSPTARPIRATLNDSAIGEAIKALTNKPAYTNFDVLGENRKPEALGKYTPPSTAGKVVKGASGIAADLLLYILGSELATPVRAGIGAMKIPTTLKPLQYLAKHGAAGATMFGTAEAIKSPIKQLADTGDIKLDRWAEDTAEGIKQGAVLEPSFALGAKVLGLPFKVAWKALRGKLLQKGYAITEEQAAKSQAAYESALAEAEAGKDPATLLKQINKLDNKEARILSVKQPLAVREKARVNLDMLRARREILLEKVRELPGYEDYAATGMSERDTLKTMKEALPAKKRYGERFDLSQKRDRQQYAQYLYKEAAKENGIKTYELDPVTGQPEVEVESSRFQKFMLNTGELFDVEEAQSGVKMGHIPSMLTEISNEGKNRTLAYRDILANTLSVDGKRLKKLLLGEITPATAGEAEAMNQARYLLKDVIHPELVKQGLLKEAQFVNHYVPREGIPGVKEAPNLQIKGSRPIVERKQSFQHQRTAELERMGAEPDAHKLIAHYIAKVERGIMLRQAIPDIQKASWQLRALGRNGKARELEKYAEKALGLEPSGKMTIFEAELANGTADEIMNILKFAGVPRRDLSKSIYEHILSMNYNALIGMNPKMLFYEQPLQGRIYGDIEMGHEWNSYGENMRPQLARQLKLPLMEHQWTGRGKSPLPIEVKAAVERNYNKLLGPELEPLEQLGDIDTSKLPGKGENIFKLLSTFSKLGMRRFQKLEHLNRASTFVSGWNKFRTLAEKGDAKELQKAMQTLNTSQKRQVMEFMAKGDIEGAADRFGLTMANRVHFLYSAFDKPMSLQGDIGSLIPFTTWTRNQFARMYTDVSHGDTKTMIRRLLIPILYAKAMEYGAGLQPKGQSGSQLLQASTGVGMLNAGPAPTLAAVGADIAKGQFSQIPRAVTSTTSILKPISMVQDLFKKKPGFGGFNFNKYSLPAALMAGGATLVGEAAAKEDVPVPREDNPIPRKK